MSTVQVTLNVVSSASTSITFTPQGVDANGNYEGPLAAGTILGVFAVEPSTWTGSIALSGDPNVGDFAINGMNLVAATEVPVGSYNLTATATP